MSNWISLHEYAVKYKVSVSTLRRRIKSEKIHYRLTDGKYFLEDAFDPLMLTESAQMPAPTLQGSQATLQNQLIENLVTEIKNAYSLIIQERDTQIKQFRGQVADLETLVRALETENERLTKQSDTVSPTQPERSTSLFGSDPLSQFYGFTKNDE